MGFLTGAWRDIIDILTLIAIIALIGMIIANSRQVSELIATSGSVYGNLLSIATRQTTRGV